MATIPEALNLALQHHRAGRLPEAEALYRQILQAQPDHPGALHLLGMIAYQAGRHEVAVEYVKQAIALNPAVAEFHNNLGTVYLELGRIEAAQRHLDTALQLQPGYAEAQYNLANLLRHEGKFEEAVAHYRKAIELKPDYAAAYNNLGLILHGQRKPVEAVAHYQKALALMPAFAEAHNNLGITLVEQGRLAEAVAHYQRALVLKPAFAEAHGNLGNAFKGQGRLEEAVTQYRRVLALRPDWAEAHANLGAVLQNQGRLEEAVVSYRQAVALKADYADVHSNLLLCLHLLPGCDQASLFAEHRGWYERHARHLTCLSREPYANRRETDRRLRVGYVSADFMRHSIRHALEPVLAMHDKAQVEVYCYSMVVKADDVTARMKTHADHWRSICGMNDAEVAGLIRADEIDILVDLSGHTEGNRLLVFARKPAPVQVTWPGYCNTTGLEVMDYLITDRFLSPPEGGQLFTEQLIRLPGCRICYSTLEYAPPVTPCPVRARGYPTFGCFNNLVKVNAEVIATWARILHRVPAARLVLKAESLDDPATREECHRYFREQGIATDRIDLVGRSPRSELLAQYGRIDIALDPFPFPGGVTTCEALWMGVPVITLAGTTLLSRGGVSLLSNVGMPELIAGSREHYVELAVQLSREVDRLATLREGLRARVAASPLCDATTFTRELERAYRTMWRTWCVQGGSELTKG